MTAVRYQLNNTGWSNGIIAANGTNWSTSVLTPLSGANLIQTYATDAAGNVSLTNAISFVYQIQSVADWAPDSLNGLIAAVTPSDATNGLPENAGFDVSTFAQTGLNSDTNNDDYGAGNYSYVKTSTNTAQLMLNYTTPPDATNDIGLADLVFTNHYSGYYSNTGGMGGFSVTIATNFLPANLTGKTLTAIDSGNTQTNTIKFVNGVSFTKKPANSGTTGTSSGTYTLTRFSPVSGMLTFTFTDVADLGQVTYVQLTFTNTAAGTYFVNSFDNLGNLKNSEPGRFTIH